MSEVSSEFIPNNKNDFKCAPNMTFENGSCITLDLLEKMAKAYNNKNRNKIKLSSKLDSLNPGKYKRYLLRQFKDKLSNVCESQSCWLKQSFISSLTKEIKTELRDKTFRPEGPEGKFTWLNTFNINDVMFQYEDKLVHI